MAKKPKGSQKTTTGTGGAEKEPGRFKQIGMVAKVVHQQGPRGAPLALPAALLILAVFIGIGVWTGSWILWPLTGLPVARLVGVVMFARTAQRVEYRMLDGRMGGGMVILENMRGNWVV